MLSRFSRKPQATVKKNKTDADSNTLMPLLALTETGKPVQKQLSYIPVPNSRPGPSVPVGASDGVIATIAGIEINRRTAALLIFLFCGGSSAAGFGVFSAFGFDLFAQANPSPPPSPVRKSSSHSNPHTHTPQSTTHIHNISQWMEEHLGGELLECRFAWLFPIPELGEVQQVGASCGQSCGLRVQL